MSERRLKIALVNKDLFLDVFGALAKKQVIALPVTDELPEGVELVRVYDDFQRGMWGLVLRHDSFPIVPDGHHIQVLNNPYLPLWEFKRVSLNDPADTKRIEILIQDGEKYEGRLTPDNMVIVPLSVFERMTDIQMIQKI